MTRRHKDRFDRPGLYWTVTRSKNEPYTFVCMRVTSVRISRIYGGIDDFGCFRSPDECYGRFATMNECGRYASRLNFILAQTRINLSTVDNEINRLNLIREEMIHFEAQALYAEHSQFPQLATMADRYSKA